MNEEYLSQNGLTRREVLKVLSAGGGALSAAAFLPASWSKPMVEAGALPAHAQVSFCAALELLADAECPGGETCSGFNRIAGFGFSPPELVPSRVEVAVCGVGVFSVFSLAAPGQLMVFYKLPTYPTPYPCEDDLALKVSFRGGCTASYP